MDKYYILKKYFGYARFKYPQDVIIDSIDQGTEVIGILPTGFGKSIIYQVLALMQTGISIIISPLIALMEDQIRGLKTKGIEAAMIHSNLSFEQQQRIYQELMRGKYKILYISPERLKNKDFQKSISNLMISMLVVDEAHTLLWAEGFREAYGRIEQFIQKLKKRPKILAVTATATPQTIKKITHYLNLNHPMVIEIPMDRPNLFYKVIHTKNKVKELQKYLKLHSSKKGILYCLTRKSVKELHQKLQELNFFNAYYHGGMTLEQKQENQKNFTNGIFPIMVCTNAFGMGIDLPDIRYVIEVEPPQSIEDLVQHLGRAARDGGYGEGIVLFSFDDIKKITYFLEQFKDLSSYQENKRKADALVDYCLSKRCRHQLISAYFNQSSGTCKGFCDNCKKKSR